MSAFDPKADIVPSLNEAELSRYDTFANRGRHEAARVHPAACRRGGDVAGAYACANTEATPDRLPFAPFVIDSERSRVPPGATRTRLRRGEQHLDRIPFRRWEV